MTARRWDAAASRTLQRCDALFGRSAGARWFSVLGSRWRADPPAGFERLLRTAIDAGAGAGFQGAGTGDRVGATGRDGGAGQVGSPQRFVPRLPVAPPRPWGAGDDGDGAFRTAGLTAGPSMPTSSATAAAAAAAARVKSAPVGGSAFSLASAGYSAAVPDARTASTTRLPAAMRHAVAAVQSTSAGNMASVAAGVAPVSAQRAVLKPAPAVAVGAPIAPLLPMAPIAAATPALRFGAVPQPLAAGATAPAAVPRAAVATTAGAVQPPLRLASRDVAKAVAAQPAATTLLTAGDSRAAPLGATPTPAPTRLVDGLPALQSLAQSLVAASHERHAGSADGARRPPGPDAASFDRASVTALRPDAALIAAPAQPAAAPALHVWPQLDAVSEDVLVDRLTDRLQERLREQALRQLGFTGGLV